MKSNLSTVDRSEPVNDYIVARPLPGKATRVEPVQMRAASSRGHAKEGGSSETFLEPLVRGVDGREKAAARSAEGGKGESTRGVIDQMGVSFGEDFSSVRVHEDEKAASTGALAIAQGNDIHFASGQLDPETTSGRELLGHELAHVVQQRKGRVAATRSKNGVAINDDVGLEDEADRAGAAAARGEPVTLSAVSTAGSVPTSQAVQRSPDDSALGECPDPGGALGVTADSPRSDIDWAGALPDGWNLIRSGLEPTRLVPIIGLVTGLGADVIEGAQNLSTGASTDSNLMQGTLAFRQVVVALNNIVGHALYLGELGQDAALISVVGAEGLVATLPANELMATTKACLHGAQTVIDILVLTGAMMGEENSVVGSEEWEAYRSLANGFLANTTVDVLGGITAILDASSAGATNAEVVSKGAKGVVALAGFGEQICKNWKGIGLAWLSIWGGNGFEAIRGEPGQEKSAEGLSANEAAPHILEELGLMDGVHQSGGAMIDAAAEQVDAMLADYREFHSSAIEGREPFEIFQGALVEGLGQFETRLTSMTKAEALASTAETETALLLAGIDRAEELIGSLTLPEIALPEHTELGDNALANVVEMGIDKGTELGNSALVAVQAQLQAGIDRAKESVVTELRPQRAEVEKVAQFIATFKRLVAEQIAFVRDAIARLKEAIAKAKEPLDIIDAMIAEVANTLGMEGEISLVSLQAEWEAGGAFLSELREWATSLV